MRNMVAHNGDRADRETANAYIDFAAIAAVLSYKLSEVPQHHPVIVGKQIQLELRGVIGLSDVIFRITHLRHSAL